VSPSVVLSEEPFIEAVMTACVLLLTGRVLTGKVAPDSPGAMLIVPGTTTELLLVDKATLVAVETAPLKPNVHDDAPGGITLAGVHVRLDSAPAGVKVSCADFATPFRDAVMIAVLIVPSDGAVAVKLAAEYPVRTFTDAGTPAELLPLDNVTARLFSAARLKVTVQSEAPGGVITDGVQVRFESAAFADWAIVTAEPLAVSKTRLPAASAPKALEIPTTEEALGVVAEIWKVMAASAPLPRLAAFSPATTHRMSPGEIVLQAATFPAVLAAAPVV